MDLWSLAASFILGPFKVLFIALEIFVQFLTETSIYVARFGICDLFRNYMPAGLIIIAIIAALSWRPPP